MDWSISGLDSSVGNSSDIIFGYSSRTAKRSNGTKYYPYRFTFDRKNLKTNKKKFRASSTIDNYETYKGI
jgi:hypothetical protein